MHRFGCVCIKCFQLPQFPFLLDKLRILFLTKYPTAKAVGFPCAKIVNLYRIIFKVPILYHLYDTHFFRLAFPRLR